MAETKPLLTEFGIHQRMESQRTNLLELVLVLWWNLRRWLHLSRPGVGTWRNQIGDRGQTYCQRWLSVTVTKMKIHVPLLSASKVFPPFIFFPCYLPMLPYYLRITSVFFIAVSKENLLNFERAIADIHHQVNSFQRKWIWNVSYWQEIDLLSKMSRAPEQMPLIT